MNKRENLLSLLRRQGYEQAPVEFSLCPSLHQQYKERIGSDLSYNEYFGFPSESVGDLRTEAQDKSVFLPYYDFELKPGTHIDNWGVAHEPGSDAAMHMTYMRHPLCKADSVEQILSYPYPDFANADGSHQKAQVERIHRKGLAAMGGMQMTIWETAWYLRSMEELMMDMLGDDPKAEALLNRVTDYAVLRAQAFARAGVDLLFLGDDIGMQRTPLMGIGLYTEWLKPRLKRVIDAAKAVKPDIIVLYHSCGFVTPFIPHLIEAGIDVLNPVQPECMDFERIHAEFGDRLSFHGAIGTQSTMPFGTPEEVRSVVRRNLEIAGDKGGLFAAPTHLLEPEVPWENILAYVEACREMR